MTARTLKCVLSEHVFEDDGILNEEPGCVSLLRADYELKEFIPRPEQPGLYRYASWLPVNRILEGSASPVAYKSEKLGCYLGLSRLYIVFSGYWPERGAMVRTGTFKECEAYSVCARFPADKSLRLVVASAGNTARAFMRVANDNSIPLVIVIPEKNMDSLYSVTLDSGSVCVVAAGGDSDYFDAISLANRLCQRPGYINEGGAKNVARRDGMGVTVLSAAEAAGEIPDYYVQAIGSGTGAIAAYEANLRLNDSGMFHPKKMKLMLSQNSPFTPIADAWDKREKQIDICSIAKAKADIAEIAAKTLSNRTPPYSIAGGLFDALSFGSGCVDTVTNAELREAQSLFERLEGCDICPESGVALASLVKSAENNHIDRDALIMLNITGGGYRRILKDLKPGQVKPDVVIPPQFVDSDIAIDMICKKIITNKF